MTAQNISHVAVIGGGRWGLVICSVLEHLLPASIPIWLVSRHLAPDRIPARVRRIFHAHELPSPNGAGAAVVATAPHDHAETGARLLSRGWHVLVEKPLALDLRSARALVERAAELQRHLWVGLVYLFASYLSIIKPYVGGKNCWLEWCEPAEEIRWGELKSTPYHVTVIEDVFPHAWSILRGAGLTEPIQVQKVDMVGPDGALLHLATGEATVHLMFDRHAVRRRRYLRIEADNSRCELDFSEEPGIFKVDGKVRSDPPWRPEMRLLALELSGFLMTCAGGAPPQVPVTAAQSLEAVALMEEATKALIEYQIRAIADAICGRGSLPELGCVLFGALCREAAMAGLRIGKNSDAGRAMTAAALAVVGQEDRAVPELPAELATVVRDSSFLARILQERDALLAGLR